MFSIKGIGDHADALLLAEMPDITRFDSVGYLTAFAGLTPWQLQSGNSNRHFGHAKMGAKRI